MEWKINSTHEGMFIRDYLKTVHGFSNRILIAIKHKGGAILVNSTPQTVRYRLRVGDKLEIQFPPEEKGALMIAEKLPLSIIAEDEDIIIINKKPGMATTPSPHNTSGTVANRLLAYYEAHNIPYTIHTVTRLDRDTSGLLLIAKHRYSHSLLAMAQQNGGINRKYLAIIEGHLTIKKGTLTYPIGRKQGSIIERTVSNTGKSATTHYKVISETQDHSLVEIELETGRTHQIRVHFSHIGHPLAGDNLYGGSTDKINRQALHCYELCFQHPTQNRECFFQRPIPADMKQLIGL